MNLENDSYDVTAPFEVLWDFKGQMYIAYQNKILFDRSSCSLQTYDFQDLDSLDYTKSDDSNLGEVNSKGIKFDGKNHNWLIFNEYMALPFSYMTFVIKDKIESNDSWLHDNHFDPEPYNYLFNKSTSLLNDQIVALDHSRLEYVLHNFGLIDVDLLEILYYSQTLQDFRESYKL